jgi:hypothetical protein
MLGYAVGAGLMQAIGFDMGFLVWLVGIVAASRSAPRCYS